MSHKTWWRAFAATIVVNLMVFAAIVFVIYHFVSKWW